MNFQDNSKVLLFLLFSMTFPRLGKKKVGNPSEYPTEIRMSETGQTVGFRG